MFAATYELPYEGAKEMLLVEDVDSKEYLPVPIKKYSPNHPGSILIGDISDLFLSWNAQWYTPE